MNSFKFEARGPQGVAVSARIVDKIRLSTHLPSAASVVRDAIDENPLLLPFDDPPVHGRGIGFALVRPNSRPARRVVIPQGQLKISDPALAAKGREMQFGAVMVPELKLDETPLKDSLEALQVIVEKQTNDKITPNFILQDPKGNLAGVKITLVLKNTPANAVLQYMLDQAGAKARHEEHAIVISPK